MSTLKIAVAYLRVSTDAQDLSLDAQRRAIESFAAAQGYEIARVCIDEGISGAAPLDRRPALLEALTALKHDDAVALIVAKRDRLARDVVTAALAERMAQRAGASVLTASGVGNGDAPENELMRTIVDAFSQYERSLISCRTRAALQAKRARGERVSGHPPFGFEWQDGHRVSVAHEQALLERMQALQAEGLGALRIASRLNESGAINPRTGRSWNRGSIASILATSARRSADSAGHPSG